MEVTEGKKERKNKKEATYKQLNVTKKAKKKDKERRRQKCR